jgi:hypothetical protein
MTTRTPWSRGERLSKANVHRCRRSHFSARTLITNPSSVFGPSSRICIARASSLASSRTGAWSKSSKRTEKEQHHIRFGGLRPLRRIVHAGPLKIMMQGENCEPVHTLIGIIYGARPYPAAFIPHECDVLRTSFSNPPLAWRQQQRGRTWHRNQDQRGSHLNSGWLSRWR